MVKTPCKTVWQFFYKKIFSYLIIQQSHSLIFTQISLAVPKESIDCQHVHTIIISWSVVRLLVINWTHLKPTISEGLSGEDWATRGNSGLLSSLGSEPMELSPLWAFLLCSRERVCISNWVLWAHLKAEWAVGRPRLKSPGWKAKDSPEEWDPPEGAGPSALPWTGRGQSPGVGGGRAPL